MNLKPIHDRIIVKLHEPESMSAGGIVLPDVVGDKPDRGVVLAVGPGRRNERGEMVAPSVAAGDVVLFGKFSGQTIKADGQDVLVMRDEDVFAIVSKGEQQ